MSSKYLQTSKQQLVNAIGTDLCWGWSPAVDLAHVVQQWRMRQVTRESGDKTLMACGHGPRVSVSGSSCGTTGATDDESWEASTGVSAGSAAPPSTSVPAASGDDFFESLVSEVQRERAHPMDDAGAPPLAVGSSTEALTPSTANHLRVLLCGAADVRHVLKTVSAHRAAAAAVRDGETARPSIHFFLFEPNLRVQCRHLLFLFWLLEASFSLSELEDRTLMFLEVFGNTRLRDLTASTVKTVATRLLTALERLRNDAARDALAGGAAQLDGLGRNGADASRLINIEGLKEKEKDFIEEQVRHWIRDSSASDADRSWLARLRQEMAERFDNRDNIMDWEYNFDVAEYSSLLKFQEYRTWRNTGVAYDAVRINPRRGFTYEYTQPNKTLCHFDRRGRGAYLGDIKNGPFHAMGATTANRYLHERDFDGSCKYGNGVVAMHNVRAWLYTLLTGREWPWGAHRFAWDDESNYNYLPPGVSVTESVGDGDSAGLYGGSLDVQFDLVGLDLEKLVLQVQEGKQAPFDVIFVGSTCTQFLEPDLLFAAMSDSGVVVAETIKFVSDAKDEAKAAFVAKVTELATKAGWEVDEALTNLLHADVPPPRKFEDTLTSAQAISLRRYQLHHQLAIVKGSKGMGVVK